MNRITLTTPGRYTLTADAEVDLVEYQAFVEAGGEIVTNGYRLNIVGPELATIREGAPSPGGYIYRLELSALEIGDLMDALGVAASRYHSEGQHDRLDALAAKIGRTHGEKP